MSGAEFYPLTPQRILDTRSSSPLGAGDTLTLAMPSVVPPTASAVVCNLTAVNLTDASSTYITLYPAGITQPSNSNLNPNGPLAVANGVTVMLGTSQSICIYNDLGTVDVVVDLEGYFAPSLQVETTSLPAGNT